MSLAQDLIDRDKAKRVALQKRNGNKYDKALRVAPRNVDPRTHTRSKPLDFSSQVQKNIEDGNNKAAKLFSGPKFKDTELNAITPEMKRTSVSGDFTSPEVAERLKLGTGEMGPMVDDVREKGKTFLTGLTERPDFISSMAEMGESIMNSWGKFKEDPSVGTGAGAVYETARTTAFAFPSYVFKKAQEVPVIGNIIDSVEEVTTDYIDPSVDTVLDKVSENTPEMEGFVENFLKPVYHDATRVLVWGGITKGAIKLNRAITYKGVSIPAETVIKMSEGGEAVTFNEKLAVEYLKEVNGSLEISPKQVAEFLKEGKVESISVKAKKSLLNKIEADVAGKWKEMTGKELPAPVRESLGLSKKTAELVQSKINEQYNIFKEGRPVGYKGLTPGGKRAGIEVSAPLPEVPKIAPVGAELLPDTGRGIVEAEAAQEKIIADQAGVDFEIETAKKSVSRFSDSEIKDLNNVGKRLQKPDMAEGDLETARDILMEERKVAKDKKVLDKIVDLEAAIEKIKEVSDTELSDDQAFEKLRDEIIPSLNKVILLERKGKSLTKETQEPVSSKKVTGGEVKEITTTDKEIVGRIIEAQSKAASEGYKSGVKDVTAKQAALNDLINGVFPKGTKSDVFKDFASRINRVRTMDRLFKLEEQIMERLGKVKEKLEGKEREKEGRKKIHNIIKEKSLEGADRIRKFNDLPPVDKMTEAQTKEYFDILNEFNAGDAFWTSKRIKAIDNTKWAGAKTLREVREKMAEAFDAPLSVVEKTKAGEIERALYDTPLAARGPFFNFMVDEINMSELKADAKFLAARDGLYDLAKKAAKSRRISLANILVPKQKNIKEYIESGNTDKTTKDMTAEEVELADYIRDFYQMALEKLIATRELQSSRFTDGTYVFHAKKPLSEMIYDIPEVGLKNTVKELLKRNKLDYKNFSAVDSDTGQVLGLSKFFRQTLHRTGQMKSTDNVIKATEQYMRDFFKKEALDEAIPAIETAAMAIKAVDKDGRPVNSGLEKFVKQYLNNKKGKKLSKFIKQGGAADAVIKLGMSFVTLAFIAFNLPLQIASVVGEKIAEVPLLGTRKILKSKIRRRTKKGKDILKKYKNFVGEGIVEEFVKPARNLSDRFSLAAYGLFKESRKNTLGDVLLGSMTKAEFKAGELSDKRLAQIKKTAGRWIDIEGSNSLYGSTTEVQAWTKFKQWAVPPITSIADDVKALTTAVKSRGKKGPTTQQAQESYRLLYVIAITTFVVAMAGEVDDDSFTGKLKKYALRELTTLTQSLSPTLWLTGGIMVAFLTKFGKNLELLIKLEKYQKNSKGGDKGDLKGYNELKKQFTPKWLRFEGGSKSKGRAGI